MTTLLIFIVLIGILVFVHELGHFVTARWMGMRADIFAVGMGPRMMGWNPINRFTFGPLPADLELGGMTDYRLCWLPIGGYVKIVGMIDESFDTDHVNKAPEEWEFRAKKNWQKAIVLSGGVIMNLLLAIAIFFTLSLTMGEQEHVVTTVAYVEPSSVAALAGIHAGDKIIAIDDVAVDTWEGVTRRMLDVQPGATKAVTVVSAQGTRRMQYMQSSDIIHALSSQQGLGLYPAGIRVVLGAVDALRPAGKAGLKNGDTILAVDDVPIRVASQFQKYVRAHAGDSIVIHVERAGIVQARPVLVGQDSLIHVEIGQSFEVPVRTITYGPLEALGASLSQVGGTISTIGTSIAAVFNGSLGVRQSFGGPIRIAEMAAKSSELGMEPFLRFMALISISLAVMNVLPLPGLDGGHLVFVGVEAIMRREIPTNVKIRFQQVGIYILLALMAFVFYLDLSR